MRRGGPGLAALDRSIQSSAQYSTLGSELTASQVNELRNQLDVFSNALRQFAQQHRKDIVRDANFRHAFQQMCANIGVDPLAGGPPKSMAATALQRGTAGTGSATGKLAGLWNDFLGLSDFQNELSIQIIDVCVSTRESNGGYISMKQLIRSLNQMRLGRSSIALTVGGKSADSIIGSVTENDVIQSIKLLKPLGSGYEVINLANGEKMVRSVPKELDVDSTIVMSLLSLSIVSSMLPTDALGQTYITQDDLIRENISVNKTKWTMDRASSVLFGMSIGDGLLWVDEGVHPARYYALNLSTNLA
ncbi:hypothetical protein L7F22_039416 [Adiantum nelumboides]|nr:hypothetical protein [Adiantum nelumboides]